MNRARGFTLIEVVIALAILSMMMVAVVSSLRTFANTKIALERMTGRVDEIRLVSGFLRRSIEGAIPAVRHGVDVQAITFGGGQTTYFSGAPSELTWVAPIAGGYSFGGAFLLQLRRENEQLVLRWQPYKANAENVTWDNLRPRVLLEDVEAFELAYRPSYEDDWEREWDGAIKNPVSVRANIKAGGRFWPELVMRLDYGSFE